MQSTPRGLGADPAAPDSRKGLRETTLCDLVLPLRSFSAPKRVDGQDKPGQTLPRASLSAADDAGGGGEGLVRGRVHGAMRVARVGWGVKVLRSRADGEGMRASEDVWFRGNPSLNARLKNSLMENSVFFTH